MHRFLDCVVCRPGGRNNSSVHAQSYVPSLAMHEIYPKENITSHSIEYAGGQQESAAKVFAISTLTKLTKYPHNPVTWLKPYPQASSSAQQ
eukprot:8276430-Heterocapsa_arctica.AAC.1